MGNSSWKKLWEYESFMCEPSPFSVLYMSDGIVLKKSPGRTNQILKEFLKHLPLAFSPFKSCCYPEWFWNIDFSRNGRIMIVSSLGEGVNVFTIKSFKPFKVQLLRKIPLYGATDSYISPDGKILAIKRIKTNVIKAFYHAFVSRDVDKLFETLIFDCRSGRLLRILKGFVPLFGKNIFSADGQLVATLRGKISNRIVCIWEAKSGKLVEAFKIPGVSTFSFFPTRKNLLALGGTKLVILDLSTGKLREKKSPFGFIWQLFIHPSEEFLFTVHPLNGTLLFKSIIGFWDICNLKSLQAFHFFNVGQPWGASSRWKFFVGSGVEGPTVFLARIK